MARDKNATSSRMSLLRRPQQIDRLIDQFLDAACDPSRRSILELLIPPEGEESPMTYELRAGEIARLIGLAPSTTSEHLHHLTKLRLVSTRKEGNMVYYRLRNHHLVRAFHELLQALSTHYAAIDGSPSEHEAVGE